jgi:hypothetical protein
VKSVDSDTPSVIPRPGEHGVKISSQTKKMKIEIRRSKVTVHSSSTFPFHDTYSVTVEEPTPDEAMATVSYDHKLPIGARLTAKEIRSRVIETDDV